MFLFKTRKQISDARYSSEIHNTDTLDDITLQAVRLASAMSEVLNNKQLSEIASATGLSLRDLKRLIAVVGEKWDEILSATGDIYEGVSSEQSIILFEKNTTSRADRSYSDSNEALLQAGEPFLGSVFTDREEEAIALTVSPYANTGEAVMVVASIVDSIPEIAIETSQNHKVLDCQVRGNFSHLRVSGELVNYSVSDGDFLFTFELGKENPPLD